jgi:purine-binding chemotaxis protein CheW
MSHDPQKKALLDERARRLAERETTRIPRQLYDRVTLVEAGRERYGLALGHLREITRATPIAPLPGLPPFMLGVTAIRGELVSVVELAELRGSGRTGNSALYALVEASGRTLALCFSGVLGIRDVFVDEIAGDLLTDEFVKNFTRAVTRDYVQLLDIERLVHSERLIVGHSTLLAADPRTENS